MSMAALQVIGKVLSTKDISLLRKYGLSADNIHDPRLKETYQYIETHYSTYGNVPDIASLTDKFPDVIQQLVPVGESDKYIAEALWEDHLYHLSAEVINKCAELMQTNSVEGVQYLQSQLGKLTATLNVTGTNIITTAHERLEMWEKKRSGEIAYIPTGFHELDSKIEGFAPGEELVVVVARTGVGKTFVLTKMLTESWQSGRTVGLIEPEMSPQKIGYRFDSTFKHFSNSALSYGRDLKEDESKYRQYVDELSQRKTPFYVASPRDFGGRVAVSNVRSFCEANKIEVLAIDGISYMTDERGNSTDSVTTAMTNISSDLMDLSIELGIPIIIVVQSNRENGVASGGSKLDLSNIRDSDGIAYSASLVISLYRKDNALHLDMLKNRNGPLFTLAYDWDTDAGRFAFLCEGEYSSNEDTSEDENKGYRPASQNNSNGPPRPSRAMPTYGPPPTGEEVF